MTTEALGTLVMPALPQTIALVVGAVANAVLFIIACRQCRRYRTGVPLLLLIAAACTVALEPIVGVLGHGFHPAIGQIALFTCLGRAIPLHIALIYTVYYGSFYILLYPALRAGTVTRELAWKLFWVTVVAAFVFEIPPLQAGLWVYYDPQALWVWRGGMPIFWVVANAVSLLVPLTLIKAFLPICTGWRQWLLVPLSPMGAIMGHVGTGFPFYIAANSPVPQWLVDLGGVASFGLAVLVVGVCAQVLSTEDFPRPNRRNAPRTFDTPKIVR
jgi:hypothetical protein